MLDRTDAVSVAVVRASVDLNYLRRFTISIFAGIVFKGFCSFQRVRMLEP